MTVRPTGAVCRSVKSQNGTIYTQNDSKQGLMINVKYQLILTGLFFNGF